jgi:hypothetical protein
MKKLIFMTIVAAVAMQVAKKYNINSIEDLKNLVFSKAGTDPIV